MLGWLLLALLALVSLGAGAAVAGALGGPRLRTAAGPTLALLLPGALALPLLWLLPPPWRPALPWVVMATLAVLAWALRRDLTAGGAFKINAAPSPLSPLERLAALAVFLALGVLIVSCAVLPLPLAQTRLGLGYAAKALATSAWPLGPTGPGELLPGPPGSPLLAALASLAARTLGTYDERLLAALSLGGCACALWALWVETGRGQIEGRGLIVAALALLPAQFSSPSAGAVAGTPSALLGALYLTLFLTAEPLLESPRPRRLPREQGHGRENGRWVLLIALAALAPWLAPAAWPFLLAGSLLAALGSLVAGRSLLLGPALLAAPLAAALPLALLGNPWARALLPALPHGGQPLWQGPTGASEALAALLGSITQTSLLAWSLLLALGAALLDPRRLLTPKSAGPLMLAIFYLPACALIPTLARGTDALQARLLEIAPLGLLALGRLLEAAQQAGPAPSGRAPAPLASPLPMG